MTSTTDDKRTNFEVVTDLLWASNVYTDAAMHNKFYDPNTTTFEQAREKLNLALKDVFARMPDDGYNYFEV